MTIDHLQIVSVPVSDVDRARAFYVDQLGLDLIRDNPMGPDQRWVQVGPRGSQASLTLVTWFDSMPAGSLRGLVLNTDDLDGDVAGLIARGVPIEDGIQDAPWGRYVTFADPDGNGIVLQTPPAGPAH